MLIEVSLGPGSLERRERQQQWAVGEDELEIRLHERFRDPQRRSGAI